MAKNNKKALSLSDLQSLLPVVKEEIVVVKVEELQPLPYGEASKDILMSWLKEANLPLDGWFYVYQDFSRSFTSPAGWYRRETGEWENPSGSWPESYTLKRKVNVLYLPYNAKSSNDFVVSSYEETKEVAGYEQPLDSGGYRDSSRKWN